jgi:hypothetical protein
MCARDDPGTLSTFPATALPFQDDKFDVV